MKKIICVFLCLFTVFASQTYAMEVTFDRDTHTVSISGTAEKNERVAVIITDSDVTDPDKMTPSVLKAHSIGFYETTADDDGKYSISVGVTKSEGVHNFFVSGADTKDKGKEELYTKTELDSALKALSDAAAVGEAQVSEKLKDEHFRKVTGLDELYDRLSDKSVLAGVIAQNSSYGSYAELSGVSDSVKAMQDFCDKFNETINKVQVKDLVKELQSLYGGDDALYTKYFDLKSTDYIDKVIFGKKPYDTISEFYNAFAAATEEYRETPVNSGGSSGGGSRGGLSVVFPAGAVSANGTDSTGDKGGINDTQTFSDVDPGSWYYSAVGELYRAGIINGVSSDKFAPDEPVKREEFVKMLVMLTGLEVGAQKDTFTDTDKSAWYSPYLAVAQECGLTFGREDGSFGVGEVLTRQDMAVLAARVLGTEERADTGEFTDEYEISDYARNSVGILCGLKVINGMGDGSFAPKKTATRAQAAKVIYDLAKIMK